MQDGRCENDRPTRKSRVCRWVDPEASVERFLEVQPEGVAT